jgi:hypothetical protein
MTSIAQPHGRATVGIIAAEEAHIWWDEDRGLLVVVPFGVQLPSEISRFACDTGHRNLGGGRRARQSGNATYPSLADVYMNGAPEDDVPSYADRLAAVFDENRRTAPSKMRKIAPATRFALDAERAAANAQATTAAAVQRSRSPAAEMVSA